MLLLYFIGGMYDGGKLELEETRPASRKNKHAPSIPAIPARVYLSRDGAAYAYVYERLRNLSAISASYKVSGYVSVRNVPRGAVFTVVS